MEGQRLDPGQLAAIDKKFEREYEYAIKSNTHFWQAIVNHRISDETAKAIVTGDNSVQPNFDLESMMGLVFGCLICEEPLDRKLIGKRCKGEPKGSPWRRM